MERPILFSRPMVQAILAGGKTQTRRLIKGVTVNQTLDPMRDDAMRQGFPWFSLDGVEPKVYGHLVKCPYGKPGDQLWVRETAWIYRNNVGMELAKYPADAPIGAKPLPIYNGTFAPAEAPKKATPSIHVPRRHSRIQLEIVKVHVERLQDISERDAMAEGAEPMLVPPDGGSQPHVEGFRDIWEKINGKASWDENPLVWVVEFKRLKP